MKKFLFLGASSEIALGYARQEQWDEKDILVLQYNNNSNGLAKIQGESGCQTEILQCDFLSEGSADSFCKRLLEMDFVPTHILHTNAIPVNNKYFREDTWDAVQRQMEVQCGSLFRVLKAVLPRMAKNKEGKIVTVLSSYVLGTPPKYLTSYVMAKYALMGLVKSLVKEYASKNIQINAVSPSMIDTRFCRSLSRHVLEQSASQNPMKRNAEVSDIIPVLKLLFDDRNTFITGANIPVTGGEIY